MPKEPEITWVLTMAQANQIMATLAKQPFGEVADLIALLQQQAQSQLQPQPGTSGSVQMPAKPNGEAATL